MCVRDERRGAKKVFPSLTPKTPLTLAASFSALAAAFLPAAAPAPAVLAASMAAKRSLAFTAAAALAAFLASCYEVARRVDGRTDGGGVCLCRPIGQRECASRASRRSPSFFRSPCTNRPRQPDAPLCLSSTYLAGLLLRVHGSRGRRVGRRRAGRRWRGRRGGGVRRHGVERFGWEGYEAMCTQLGACTSAWQAGAKARRQLKGRVQRSEKVACSLLHWLVPVSSLPRPSPPLPLVHGRRPAHQSELSTGSTLISTSRPAQLAVRRSGAGEREKKRERLLRTQSGARRPGES